MDPTVSSGAQPGEMASMQGYPNPGYPSYPGNSGYPAGQPTAPAVVQYTTVTVDTAPPKDHVLWSFFNFVYGNPCCLGLVALIYSVKARDRKVVGDAEGARQHASTSRILNIVASVIISVCLLIVIIVYSMRASFRNLRFSH